MQRAASSIVRMVMKPKPRERSVWGVSAVAMFYLLVPTHTLVVDNGHLLDVTVARELILEVTLVGADREAKDTENRVGLDIGSIVGARGRGGRPVERH